MHVESKEKKATLLMVMVFAVFVMIAVAPVFEATDGDPPAEGDIEVIDGIVYYNGAVYGSQDPTAPSNTWATRELTTGTIHHDYYGDGIVNQYPFTLGTMISSSVKVKLLTEGVYVFNLQIVDNHYEWDVYFDKPGEYSIEVAVDEVHLYTQTNYDRFNYVVTEGSSTQLSGDCDLSKMNGSYYNTYVGKEFRTKLFTQQLPYSYDIQGVTGVDWIQNMDLNQTVNPIYNDCYLYGTPATSNTPNGQQVIVYYNTYKYEPTTSSLSNSSSGWYSNSELKSSRENSSTQQLSFYVFVYPSQNSSRELSIEYDANGGTGAPAKQTFGNSTTAQEQEVSTTKPQKSGYLFAGWATYKNSNVVIYQPGSPIMLDGKLKLYAVWATPLTNLTLDRINDNLDGCYVLTENITLPSNWTPIGTEYRPFTGTILGNGNYIMMQYSSLSQESFAFFDYLEGSVQEIEIIVSFGSSSNPISFSDSISGSFNTVKKTNTVMIAPLAIHADGAVIKYCHTTGNIYATSTLNCTGGGNNNLGYTTFDVNNILLVAGITIHGGEIIDSYSDIRISAGAETVLTNTNTEIASKFSAVTKLAGITIDGDSEHCYFAGHISGVSSVVANRSGVSKTQTVNVGGITLDGTCKQCIFLNNFTSNTQTSISGATSKTDTEMRILNTYKTGGQNWDFDNIWYLVNDTGTNDNYPSILIFTKSIQFRTSLVEFFSSSSDVRTLPVETLPDTVVPTLDVAVYASDGQQVSTNRIYVSGQNIVVNKPNLAADIYTIKITASAPGMRSATVDWKMTIPPKITNLKQYVIQSAVGEWMEQTITFEPAGTVIDSSSMVVRENGSVVTGSGNPFTINNNVLRWMGDHATSYDVSFDASYTKGSVNLTTSATITVNVKEVTGTPEVTGIIISKQSRTMTWMFIANGNNNCIAYEWTIGDDNETETTVNTAAEYLIYTFHEQKPYKVTLKGIGASNVKTDPVSIQLLAVEDYDRTKAWVGFEYTAELMVSGENITVTKSSDWPAAWTLNQKFREDTSGNKYLVLYGTPGEGSTADKTYTITVKVGSTKIDEWNVTLYSFSSEPYIPPETEQIIKYETTEGVTNVWLDLDDVKSSRWLLIDRSGIAQAVLSTSTAFTLKPSEFPSGYVSVGENEHKIKVVYVLNSDPWGTEMNEIRTITVSSSGGSGGGTEEPEQVDLQTIPDMKITVSEATVLMLNTDKTIASVTFSHNWLQWSSNMVIMECSTVGEYNVTMNVVYGDGSTETDTFKVTVAEGGMFEISTPMLATIAIVAILIVALFVVRL